MKFIALISLFLHRWLRLQAEDVDETDMVGSGKIWLGKDYCNFVAKDFVDLDMPYHGGIARQGGVMTVGAGKYGDLKFDGVAFGFDRGSV